jgi:glycosyltransferase involved in cell wall biosynthesis/GT2 family glycosyltransferase
MAQLRTLANPATQRTRATALLVLGMHRSGTSALARVCNLLGAQLGDNLLPPASDNEAGFWEQREIQVIHDNLLHALGSKWDDHRRMPDGWVKTPPAETAKAQILNVLRREFNGAKLFVVKDPRMCRLVPLWVSVVSEIGAEPRFLLIVRNPLEVAASLGKRDGFPAAKAALLWLRHALDAEHDTRDFPRAIVSYQAMLADWRRTISIAAGHLGLDVTAQIQRHGAGIDAFLSTERRHHRFSEDALALDPIVSGWARRVFTVSQQMCRATSVVLQRRLDRIAAELDSAQQLYGTWLSQQQGDLVARRIRIDGLGRELDAARAEAALRETQVQALTQESCAVRALMADRDARVGGLTRELEEARAKASAQQAEIDALIADRDARVGGLTRELEEARAKASAQQAEIDALIADRDARVGGLTRELEEARAKASAQQAEIDALIADRDARVGGLTRELEEAQTKASTQQSQIEKMALDAAAKATERETRIGELKTEVESQQKRLETVMGENGTRAKRIEELGDLLYRARRDQGALRAVARRILPVTKFMHYVDSPIGQRVATSEISLVGWCFEIGSAQRVQSIRARVGKKSFSGLCGLSRPDVAEVHAGQASPDALKLSGFQIEVALGPGQHEILLEASDAHARWRVFGKRQITVLPGGISRAQLTGTEPSTAELEEQRQQARELSYRPLISVVTAVYNTPPQVLRETIQSVLAQTYDKWELCLADGNSDKPGVREILKEFERNHRHIRIVFLDRNQGIANNTNAAMRLAKGEFIALLDHDDTLAPFALFEVVKALNANPLLDMIYSDEDKVDGEGNRYEPFFKPDWSPDLLFSFMYTGHLTVYRKKLVDELGGFRSDYDFSQDYDLALRVVERTSAIVHIQKILYHWRSIPGSAAAGDKPYARVTNLAALAHSAQRRGYSAEVLEYPFANRVKYAILGRPLVSIIIPTDREANISVCLARLLRRTRYAHVEALVVTSSQLIQQLQPRYADESKIRFVPFDRPFNFSAKCNLGASVAAGSYLLFLNDDVEPLEDDWLGNMLEVFQRPEVGAVSPKLLYADGKIQHAGLVTGVRGLAGTAFHCEAADYSGYFNMAISMRNTSALSAACMLVSKKAFEQVDGFDAENTPIMNSDLDFSFKLREKGFLLVYTPFATLRHIGHASLGKVHREPFAADKADIYLLKRWGGYVGTDPYYTESMRDMLYKDSPTKYRMTAVNRCGVDKTRGDILMVSHDLSLSGAPITLSRLAKFLRDAGYFVTVVSPENGPLLQHYEQHKIPVIIDPLILRTPAAVTTLLKNFDLIVPNTILGAQVVHAAQSIQKPCLWLVHESQFGVQMAARDPSVSDALGLADAVVFPSDHTRQLYQRFCRGNAHLALHHGLGPWPEAHRPALAKGGSKLIVVHVGSIEPRKGQDLLLKSIAALPAEIAETCEFYLLGRVLDHNFFAELQRVAQGWNQIHFLGERSHEEVLSYIQAADVFVCSSRDESWGLVVVEAMACGKAIVSTAVGAVPEIIQHEVNGLIVPVEDPDAMAQQLARLWKDRSLRERLGENARARFQQQDLTIERFGRDIENLIAKLATPVGRAQAVL